jgi:Calcineurin-like phosphoesterase
VRPARPLALLGLLALFAVTVPAACGGGGGGAARAPGGTQAPGSTLRATLADPDGDGFLSPAPGEPLRDRGPRARPGRVLATFAQLTDAHVRDEESPARVPFLDRLGDPFTSTFRPQEAFSAQVLDAAVRALDREDPQAVFVTGDLVDSAQANELEQALDVLEGREVHPDSGRRGYDGVQGADSADPFFYRPDHDAPRHPGALRAAERPFRAAGLRAPWFPALGNHDLLVQGEVPPTPAIERVATGGRLVPSLDPALRPPREEASAGAAVAAVLAGGLPGRTRRVPADPRRRHLSPAELERRLVDAAAPGTAVHTGRLDYAVDVGPAVRAIVLDTIPRDGTSRGVVRPAQVAWLRAQLAAAGSRWVLVLSHDPLDTADGGAAALAALDAHPRAVAAVSGDRHRNVIARHGHLWLVGTASLADWPQQARMFRLREGAGGGAVLETWTVDHDGRGLAGVSRELAYLDAQGGRPQGFAGTRADRNARLFVDAP